ncbi:hypothetical protein Nepgr_023390 [Nepenthes gracilis]|uniref:Uncharacterized protein n=1 Tax=Nepenthes gracilis TaxID=150966 RepID=A0AAD3T1Z9_NEPGR|nr:hypothetical protein Nepgr_023390 [Nepenthes gracilis]
MQAFRDIFPDQIRLVSQSFCHTHMLLLVTNRTVITIDYRLALFYCILATTVLLCPHGSATSPAVLDLQEQQCCLLPFCRRLRCTAVLQVLTCQNSSAAAVDLSS